MEMPEGKCITFFSPHPDDEVLAAGAMLMELCLLRNDVTIIYLTSGSDDSFLGIREREAERVCEMLGARPVFLRLDRYGDPLLSVNSVREAVKTPPPFMVFVPYELDPHPTHKFSHYVAMRYLKQILYTGRILFYSIWNPIPNPNFIFSFDSRLMERKLELLGLYPSQLERNDFKDGIKGLDRYNAVTSRELQRGWHVKKGKVPYSMNGGSIGFLCSANDQDNQQGSSAFAESFIMNSESPESLILSLGDIFLDILPDPVEREFSEGSSSTSMSFIPGGNAANFALAAARLGCASALYAKVGNDWKASLLEEQLKKYGVRCFLLERQEIAVSGRNEGICPDTMNGDISCPIAKERSRSTAATFALSFKDGDRHFFSDFGANLDFSEKDIPLFHSGFRHLHRAGYFWLPRLKGHPNRTILENARSFGMTTSQDTGTPPVEQRNDHCWKEEDRKDIQSLLPYIDILFGNEAEIFGMSGIGSQGLIMEEDMLQPAALTLIDHGCRMVAVHRGEKGGTVFTGSETYQIDAPRIAPENPTGAGDIFNAAFVSKFVLDLPLKKCLRFAVAAGTLHVAHKANPYPTNDDILDFMGKHMMGS